MSNPNGALFTLFSIKALNPSVSRSDQSFFGISPLGFLPRTGRFGRQEEIAIAGVTSRIGCGSSLPKENPQLTI
jgi:hypothetical protein